MTEPRGQDRTAAVLCCDHTIQIKLLGQYFTLGAIDFSCAIFGVGQISFMVTHASFARLCFSVFIMTILCGIFWFWNCTLVVGCSIVYMKNYLLHGWFLK